MTTALSRGLQIISELAINPLGDRIVHAFFRDNAKKNDGNSFANDEPDVDGTNERVNFPDFVRVLAHFRPLKKDADKNKLNGREEKLRCEWENAQPIIGLHLVYT